MFECLLCLEMAYQSLALVDARQSQYIANTPKYYEINPLVRKYGVKKYFIATGLGHAAVTYLLPDEYKKPWLVGTIALEAVVVGRNKYLGIKMRF